MKLEVIEIWRKLAPRERGEIVANAARRGPRGSVWYRRALGEGAALCVGA
jgi:hypothetical protein